MVRPTTHLLALASAGALALLATPASATLFAPLCLPGFYAPGTGRAPCALCPRGTYSTGLPTLSHPRIVVTESLSFLVFGATSCTAASAGYVCDEEGSTGQKACGVGFYTSSASSAACLSCPTGHFCDTETCTAPKVCAAGTYAPAGASACKACPAGYTSRTSAHPAHFLRCHFVDIICFSFCRGWRVWLHCGCCYVSRGPVQERRIVQGLPVRLQVRFRLYRAGQVPGRHLLQRRLCFLHHLPFRIYFP
jgi:hypothetical protein